MAQGGSTTRELLAADETTARERILRAALGAFAESGYAQASTLEIATRAQVSKRALYSLIGNKQELLIACIGERLKRLKPPADFHRPKDLADLSRLLVDFGTTFLSELTDPAAVAVFRLAIGEAVRAPEIAQALGSAIFKLTRSALKEIMVEAKASGLLTGAPAEMTEQFASLLWGDLLMKLLLQIVDRPTGREIAGRAEIATKALLTLHSKPN